MLVEELLRCQIQEWYPTFRPNTIRTLLHPIPLPFLRYLKGQHPTRKPKPLNPTSHSESEPDSPPRFLLPATSSGRDPFPLRRPRLPDPVSHDEFELWDDSSGSESDSEEAPSFPELEAAVDAAIAELGGAAFPKLTWSAPKDAAWISAAGDGTLRCRSFADVALLLRASDNVAHDLLSALPSCSDYAAWRNGRGGGGGDGSVRRNAQENDGGGGDGIEGVRQNAQENDTNGVGSVSVRRNVTENGSGHIVVQRIAEEESGGDEVVRGNGIEIGSNGHARHNAAESTGDDVPQNAAERGDTGSPGNVAEDDEGDFQFFLALRKWYPGLLPESEFRCFVWGQRLVAISQRDPSVFYPSLPGRRAVVQTNIEEFFTEVVRPRFGSEDYTFDVYVKRDEKVKLIDFNPWGAFTLPLMFSWEELEVEGRGEEVEFRVVEHRCGVRPGLKTAVPFDMIDFSEGSGWDVFLRKAEEEFKTHMGSLGEEDW